VRKFTFNRPRAGIVELFRVRSVYRDRRRFTLAGL
jgi:hypothetical protein